MPDLKRQLSKRQELFSTLLQFIKFGLVGVSNTLISYSIEMLCYYVLLVNFKWNENVRIAVTSVLAFAVSVTNSYYWNNRYVFKSDVRKTFKEHAVAYLRTVACYGVTGLILSPVLKMLAGNFGVPYWLSSLGTLVITIPLNFILNKFWAFAGKKQQMDTGENG